MAGRAASGSPSSSWALAQAERKFGFAPMATSFAIAARAWVHCQRSLQQRVCMGQIAQGEVQSRQLDLRARQLALSDAVGPVGRED